MSELVQYSQIATDPQKPERKYQCTWDGCGKTFIRETDVTRHYRIHLNDRPFKCVWPGCGKAFMQRSAVKIHYRTHTGEKPNICPFEGCNKAFNDTSSLARHRRTHHYDTPFPCSHRPCQERFATRKLLQEHERSVHKSAAAAAGKKVTTSLQADLPIGELPTPQITPDSTPRQSPNSTELALQFQSYVPPAAELNTTTFPSTSYQKEPDNFRTFDNDRFQSPMMDYRQTELKMHIPPPIRTDRLPMDRYPMNPPPMLQIHENMNMQLMSPTYSSTPGLPHSAESYSPSMLNTQMSYLHQSMLPSPDEMHHQGMMNDMGYQPRSFEHEMYLQHRRELPPRINTQLPMYTQPLTQYPPYPMKHPNDDRRFSAPILSLVYPKENPMGFGVYDQNQR